MKKIKMFFDIIKEEQWLNEQLQNGYHCTQINMFGIYTFEKTTDEYVMRLDYQDYLTKEKYREYKQLYEDFNWDCLASYRMGGIKYWQKVNDGQAEIFSDRESKAKYYKRLMNYSLVFVIISFILGKNASPIYATQGIWDLKGSLFWKVFIFETPFALIKLLPMIMAVLFAFSFYNAYRKYAVLKG